MARSIPRPDPSEYDPYYQGYLDQLPNEDVLELLATQVDDTVAALRGLTPTQAGYRYAPGKWSTREVVGHMIDVERVLTYRALRASRGDSTPIPGFEQDDYIAGGNYDDRSIDDLLREFEHVRAATLDLLSGMPDGALERRVTANGVPVSIRALACIVAGHERHHMRLFREKYLPGMDKAARRYDVPSTQHPAPDTKTQDPMPISVIDWTPDGVNILDQTRLPDEEVWLEIRTVEAMVKAIQSLRVRGAPLIGVAAAMGLAQTARSQAANGDLTKEWVETAAQQLEHARPTAVDVKWALTRMRESAVSAYDASVSVDEIVRALREMAERIWQEEIDMCRAIGDAGADLVPSGATILTHCNTGALATGGLGTAAAVVFVAHERGLGIDVVATETRPLRQGARLTAWEMAKGGVPTRVIVDSAAASLMAAGEVDLVITGADRIAANGDAANKIGTYALAVLAKAHGIPFYIAAPRSTFDHELASGDEIPIEQRATDELPTAPGADVYNPAFDVTPAELIEGIVTDRGVLRAPYGGSIRGLGKEISDIR